MYKGGHIPDSKHYMPSWQIEKRMRTIEQIPPEQCQYRFSSLQENLNKRFPEFENRLSVLVLGNKLKIISGPSILYEHNNIKQLFQYQKSPRGYISMSDNSQLTDNAVHDIEHAILKFRIEQLGFDE